MTRPTLTTQEILQNKITESQKTRMVYSVQEHAITYKLDKSQYIDALINVPLKDCISNTYQAPFYFLTFPL